MTSSPPPSKFAMSAAAVGLIQTGTICRGVKPHETYRTKVFRALRESNTLVPSTSSSTSSSSPSPLTFSTSHYAMSSTLLAGAKTDRKTSLTDTQKGMTPAEVLQMAIKAEVEKEKKTEVVTQDGKIISNSLVRIADATYGAKEQDVGESPAIATATQASGVEIKQTPDEKATCEAEKAAAEAKKSASEAAASATTSATSATTSVTSAVTAVEAAAETVAIAAALATAEAAAAEAIAAAAVAAAAALEQAIIDRLEEEVRLAERLACPKRAADRANVEGVKRTNRASAWWAPRLKCATGFLIGAFATVFVALTVLYFIYYERISDSPYVYVGLYWLLFGTLFSIVAFYIILQASAERYAAERTESSDRLQVGVITFIFGAWPLTNTLLKDLYPRDPFIRRLEVPVALLPTLEPNLVLYAQLIVCNILIDSINLTVSIAPLQAPGRVRLWRQWFHGSALLRQQWAYRRATVDEVTVLFVDQNLFPESRSSSPPPPPPPSLWANWTRNPVKFVEIVVALVTGTAFVVYVWWALVTEGALNEKLELFATIFGQFYVSAVLVAIVFDNTIEGEDTRFDFANLGNNLKNHALLEFFPQSVPLFKSLNLCNDLIQQVHVPDTIDPNLVRLFAWEGTRGLFEQIATDLRLQFPPLPYKLRAWCEAFKSCYVRADWLAARSTFEGLEGDYMNDQIFLQAECQRFYFPPGYFATDTCCCGQNHSHHHRRKQPPPI
jgi:hypothetical protein